MCKGLVYPSYLHPELLAIIPVSAIRNYTQDVDVKKNVPKSFIPT